MRTHPWVNFRTLLPILAASVLLLAVACGGTAATPTVIEKQVIVEKEVIKEVPVEKQVVVEKEVEKEVIKEVEVEKEGKEEIVGKGETKVDSSDNTEVERSSANKKKSRNK